MNCEEFSNLLDAWIDGTLSPKEEAALRAHAESCPDCALLLQMCRDARRADEETAVPASFSKAWRQKIREEEKRKEKARRKRSLTGWAAAAAVLVFVVGGTLLTRGRKTDGAAAWRGDAAQYEGAASYEAAPSAGQTLGAEDGQETAARKNSLMMALEAAPEASEEDAAVEAEESVLAEKPSDENTKAMADETPPEMGAPALQAVLSFVRDMGDFLVSALPWMAAAGILALGGWIFGKKKKQKE